VAWEVVRQKRTAPKYKAFDTCRAAYNKSNHLELQIQHEKNKTTCSKQESVNEMAVADDIC